MKRQVWLRGAVALVGVWTLAAAGLWLAHSRRMTAQKTMIYLDTHQLKGQSATDRANIITGLAERVNALSFEERQKFRYEGRLREWVEQLTPAERLRYVDLTLPKGLQQMMEAFNAMPSAKRKQIVSRAMADLSRAREEAGNRDADQALSDANIKRFVDEGMKVFIRDASADTKLDLEPLIEQMQTIMQLSR